MAKRLPYHRFTINSTDEKAFWQMVKKTDDHWYWAGKKSFFLLGSEKISPARLAYQLVKGHRLNHKFRTLRICDEQSCVNPDHQRVVLKTRYEDEVPYAAALHS